MHAQLPSSVSADTHRQADTDRQTDRQAGQTGQDKTETESQDMQTCRHAHRKSLVDGSQLGGGKINNEKRSSKKL
jgi:hypothetical protein